MNKFQKRMIQERLGALADILSQIGPKFDLSWADAEGRVWRFKIELEEDSKD